MDLLKAALGYAATTYLADTWQKPRQLGKLARQHCDAARKPLLLIHDGGVAHHLFGSPVRVEASTRSAYPLRAPDKAFGAVLAVGVLECLQHPDRALAEWRRVADRVFVVVPSWYSVHAWLNPEHRWFIDSSLKKAMPLWTSSKEPIHLLAVSDTRYGGSRWTPRTAPVPTRTPLRTSTGSPSPSPRSQQTRNLGPTPPSLPPSSSTSHPEPPRYPAPGSTGGPAMDEPNEDLTSDGMDMLPDLDEAKMPGLMNLGSADSGQGAPSESWNSVRDLMVVSSSRSSES